MVTFLLLLIRTHCSYFHTTDGAARIFCLPPHATVRSEPMLSYTRLAFDGWSTIWATAPRLNCDLFHSVRWRMVHQSGTSSLFPTFRDSLHQGQLRLERYRLELDILWKSWAEVILWPSMSQKLCSLWRGCLTITALKAFELINCRSLINIYL